MSGDKYTYLAELHSDKPIKRVRFSEEIKNVYEYECQGGQCIKTFPMENERSALSSELKCQEEFPTIGSTANAVNFGNATNTSESDQCMYDCIDKVDELTECNKQMTVTYDSCEVDSYSQLGESSSSIVHSDPTSDYFNNNNNKEMADLNMLIFETKHMAISVPDRVQKPNQQFLSKTFETCPSCDSSSEKNFLPGLFNTCPHVAQPMEKNSSLKNHKRSLRMQRARQTSKLNSCLKIVDDKVDSAVDLKNAVFNAWNMVKNESAKVVCEADVHEAKEKSVTLPKPSEVKFEYLGDVRPIRTVRKIPVKKVEPTFQTMDDDIQENKMAYYTWKKKKDELLSQQNAEKCTEEKKRRLDTLMNERMRKRKAETAFLSCLGSQVTSVLENCISELLD